MTMTTGDKIRGIRLLKEFSQENMAEMLKMSRQSYGDIERGKTDINDSRLKQIADVLGVTPADILSFGEKVNNFFDQCNSPFVNTGVNSGNENQGNTYYSDKQQLEMEKLRLEIEKLKLEKEKAELEAKYWREKSNVNS